MAQQHSDQWPQQAENCGTQRSIERIFHEWESIPILTPSQNRLESL